MYTFICKICGQKIEHRKESVMRALANKHLKMEHKLSVEDYLVKYELNGKHPKCMCGCGEDVHLSHGWTWNKYSKDSHVGKIISDESSELRKKIVESNKTKFDLKTYYSTRYDINSIELSAKDFLSKEYTLSDLENKYKIDKRTLHKLWLALELVTPEQYNEVITFNKYNISSEKRSMIENNSESVFTKLYLILREHPQKYNIYSLIEEYNKSATDKIINHASNIYKNLHKLYGDEIDIYFSKGYHSSEEFRFYDILTFYFPDWKIKVGYQISGYKYIYDFCINDYLIIEYQSDEFFHTTKYQKENDEKKKILAEEKGYLFKYLTKTDIKNIDTLKQIEIWLNSKK